MGGRTNSSRHRRQVWLRPSLLGPVLRRRGQSSPDQLAYRLRFRGDSLAIPEIVDRLLELVVELQEPLVRQGRWLGHTRNIADTAFIDYIPLTEYIQYA